MVIPFTSLTATKQHKRYSLISMNTVHTDKLLTTTGNSPRSGGSNSPFAGGAAASNSSGSANEGTASSKSNANVATPSKAVGQTVATRFTGSLHELTEVLARTQTRFVRCVKTNGLLKPQVFEKPSVLRPLVLLRSIHKLHSVLVLAQLSTGRSSMQIA
jgi:hypothetical protein